MFVPPFVMHPRPGVTHFDPFSLVRALHARVIAHSGDELLRSIFRQIMHQPLQRDARLHAVDEHLMVMFRNGGEMSAKAAERVIHGFIIS